MEYNHEKKNQRVLKSVKDVLLSQQKDNQIFCRVMSILQHTEWYTPQERIYIKELALKYTFFTKKQRNRLDNVTIPAIYDDDHYDNHDGCPDGISNYDWEEYF